MAPSPSPTSLLCAFAAAFLAGAINSVAGGGSMISFPILLALGLPPIVANATNTVGIWPGAIGSLIGFRNEIVRVPRAMFWLILPAIVGGVLGAWLLRQTSEAAFEHLVPLLLLFATALFLLQPMVQKRLSLGRLKTDGTFTTSWFALACVLQLATAVYGGYFGAGMSIVMLSILGLLGMTDILEMSAMTSVLSFFINGIAGLLFVYYGLVSWPVALSMILGAVSGGYGAAGLARRLGKKVIRRFVIFMGLAISTTLVFKTWVL